MRNTTRLGVTITFLTIASFIFLSFIDKPAYRVFNRKGEVSAYNEMLKHATQADIILFGEIHNNPICHWLQMELIRDIYKVKDDHMILGAEMFEADDQLIIDEYLSGLINEKSFEARARLWANYKTDYKPLLNFAKDLELPFIATNVPRRYANMVYHGGFEVLANLSPTARGYMPPIPFAYDSTLTGYKNMSAMAGVHGSANMPKAQALKDATMAHFILQNHTKNKVLVHFNGTYHSNNFEGIGWYLKFANPDLNVMTIATVTQNQLDTLQTDHLNMADFTLVIPETMTTTY